tara:strand:+ start:204 stop:359 length:156 start_codon:yes stop_codon:yes gene_type:complete
VRSSTIGRTSDFTGNAIRAKAASEARIFMSFTTQVEIVDQLVTENNLIGAS